MSVKALRAFRHMAEHPEAITDIVSSGTEYYFKYKDHAFSVYRREDDELGVVFSGFVYPTFKGDISGLVRYYDEGQPYDELPLVRFSTDDPSNKDFGPVLSDLYKKIADRYLNLDEIFDDVISSDN